MTNADREWNKRMVDKYGKTAPAIVDIPCVREPALVIDVHLPTIRTMRKALRNRTKEETRTRMGKRYTAEEKKNLIAKIKNGKTKVDLNKSYGISAPTLRRWIRNSHAGKEAANGR